MPKLYVIRHCEPARTGILLGRTDLPLSEAGRRHAPAIWQGLEFAALYSSPLQRALETARASGREPVIVPDLAEYSFGEWEGLSWAEAEARDPDVARRKAEDWLAVPPPGGEIWSEFLERVAGALERVRCGPMPAALVAHMTVNSAVAWWLRRADPVTYRQSYGEILTYEL